MHLECLLLLASTVAGVHSKNLCRLNVIFVIYFVMSVWVAAIAFPLRKAHLFIRAASYQRLKNIPLWCHFHIFFFSSLLLASLNKLHHYVLYVPPYSLASHVQPTRDCTGKNRKRISNINSSREVKHISMTYGWATYTALLFEFECDFSIKTL